MKAALRMVVAALAALVIASAEAQVLNLSHDLVPLGIASKNLTPNDPTLDARPLIQAGTTYAAVNGILNITVDKGNYYLLTDQQSNSTVFFNCIPGQTFDLADSTIFFRGPYLPNGIYLYFCSNYTLKNFKTDFLTPPYTHVQLTSVDPVARTIGYATLPGWPSPTSFNGVMDPFGAAGENASWLAVFRNGSIVPGTTRSLVTRPVAANTLTLTQDGTPWTQAGTLATLRAGDTIVVTLRGGGPPILIWEGNGVRLVNVTIQGSAATAVQCMMCRNSTVDNVRVVPRPGTGLLGSNSDAIHFASARENNHIVNSYVARTMDDGLVMDNQHAAIVLSQTLPRQLRVRRDQYLAFPNGTPVNFVDPATTLESPGATIVSQTPPGLFFNGVVDLTLDRDLPVLSLGTALVYADPLTRGQGSSITDSIAEDMFGGRGIWIAGMRGVTIERNVVRHTSLAGIALTTSTDPFDTGDIGPPSHDVVVRDNVVDGALGPAAAGTGTQVALGAIEVVSTDNHQFGFASAAGNTNISIVDNTILDSGRSGIWVGEVNGGVIQRNKIIGHNRHAELPIFGIPPPFVTQVNADFAVPLVVRYSTGVTKQDNVIHPTGGLRDVNGEGKSDLLWKNAATGATALWLMNDTGILSAATILSNPSWQITHTGDFNADGRTDFVWRNAGGSTAMWMQNGLVTTSSVTLFSDPSWAVLRTTDLDGDGKSDLVWRNSATGQIAAWLMNGTTTISTAILYGDPNWTITHTGDFNGDGRMDLVWRNNATGATAIWLMDGLAPSTAGVVFTSLTWTVTHVGDFDGDGMDDLVWRHSVTGQTAIWLMNGLTPSSNAVILASLPWAVTHVGDFNGDGKHDLVWRNTATGQTAIWLQNGTTAQSSALVMSDPNWVVSHTGDFNGDRKTDLAWRNTSSGALAIWLMNGTGSTGSAVGLVDPNWSLSPAEGF